MTLQEIKYDMIKRGVVFREYLAKNSAPGTIEINVTKYDTDGMEVNAHAPMYIHEYIDEVQYENNIKERVQTIENFITHRHSANINSCQHEHLLIGSKIACSKCMGKFGDRIVLDIRGN